MAMLNLFQKRKEDIMKWFILSSLLTLHGCATDSQPKTPNQSPTKIHASADLIRNCEALNQKTPSESNKQELLACAKISLNSLEECARENENSLEACRANCENPSWVQSFTEAHGHPLFCSFSKNSCEILTVFPASAGPIMTQDDWLRGNCLLQEKRNKRAGN